MLGVRSMKKKLLISSIVALSLAGLPSYSYMSPEVNSLYQQACSAEYQNNLPDAIEKLKKATDVPAIIATNPNIPNSDIISFFLLFILSSKVSILLIIVPPPRPFLSRF